MKLIHLGVAKGKTYLEPGDIIFVRSNGLNKALVGRNLYIDLNEKSLCTLVLYPSFRLKTDDFLPLFWLTIHELIFFKLLSRVWRGQILII